MLGPFEVSGEDGPVVVAGGSQRTVLALLALHAGRPVGAAALADALWPEGPPVSARNSLQSHVARLRATIGARASIALTPAGYCLGVPRAGVDVLRFEDLLRDGALTEAVALWRGPALPEFAGEPFCGVAERLAGLHREALADLVRAGGPVDRLRVVVADDPCWERGATVLAAALPRGEGLEVLRRHADAVVDRLGIDPSEDVRLPLAIELLVRGGRTSAARHRTLRAVVEWSFGLLDPAARQVLTRLSAFAGAFTVAQAEAVVAADGVAAALAALVDRSLVVRHEPGRFRLLETIRAYAASLLGDDRAELHRRHADVMLAAARRLDRAFRGPGQADAVRELDALLPDLRLAVLRGAGPGGLAAALYRYGYRCQQYEVLAWGRSAGNQPDARAAAATHAWGRGDLAEARAFAAGFDSDAIHEVLGDVALVSCDAPTALAHYRAMGTEPVHRVSGLVGEALVLAWSGRVAEAVAAAESAVDLAASTGNPGARAEALYGLGEALGDSDPERALALLAEAAELAATVDERLFRGAAETAAVAIGSRHGDPAAALSAFRDVLAMWRRVGNDTLRAAALRNLVVLLVRVGADETAVLVDAALPPADVYPAEQAGLDRARAAAGERLGADRVAALRRRGALLPAARVHDEASRAIDAALSRMAG